MMIFTNKKQITAKFISELLICCVVLFALSAVFSVSAVSYKGSGTQSDPFLVETAEQLNGMRDNLSAHYKLNNTIDLGGTAFSPIGATKAKPFTGSFVCDLESDATPKYVIKNLKVEVAVSAYSSDNNNRWSAGLFGYINGAELEGICVLDVNINNLNYGDNTGSVVYGDYKPGLGEQASAPLVGQAENSTITSCGATGIVNTQSNHAGGLIGLITDTTVSKCWSTVNVTTAGKWFCSGFIADVKGTSVVSESFCTGEVKSTNGCTAGFAGGADSGSQFVNCYSWSNLLSSGNGFTFANSKYDVECTVENCYAAGKTTLATATTPVTDKMYPVTNSYILEGCDTYRQGFPVVSAAELKAKFSGISEWDTSENLPVLSNVKAITDSSKYVPGAVTEVPTQQQQGSSNSSSGGAVTSSDSTSEAIGTADDLVKIVEKLPDSENITLENKDDIKKAVKIYDALSESEILALPEGIEAKLLSCKQALTMLLLEDVSKRITDLPEANKLKKSDVETVMDVWDDFEFLDDDTKQYMNEKLVKKINELHDRALELQNGEEAESASSGSVTLAEKVLIILLSVLVAASVGFNVYSIIRLVRYVKKNKELELIETDE